MTIKKFANDGFQLYNKTSGSQSTGKTKIAEYRPSKGYRDGLKQGYINASREIAHLFEKHLDYSTKNVINPNKNQTNVIKKFEDFLNVCKSGNEND